MTNIFNAISGQFGKALVLGTLLPATVFVILVRVLVMPLYPNDSPLLEPLKNLDTQWEVLALSFLTVVLSGLLYALNVPLIRLYEGYPWRNGLIGSWLAGRQRREFERSRAQWMAMPSLVRALRRSNDAKTLAYADDLEGLWSEAGDALNKGFPEDGSLVLPTRLGNAIRAFEGYPRRRYSMETITLWPRLVAKIEDGYATAIGDAKTMFDFMLNSSLLSAALGVALLISGAIHPTRLATQKPAGQEHPWLWLLGISASFVLAYLFYRLAIGQAVAWGDMVAGAFDLYRRDLLKGLGYQQEPATKREEQELWQLISDWLRSGDVPVYPDLAYAPRSPPSATGKASGWPQPGVALEITRGVRADGADNTVVVTVRVKNAEREREARAVTLVDQLPDGFDYIWDSARDEARNRPVPVTGTNPYRFQLGDVPPQGEACLTYRMARRN